jgi:predicted component of type VI protein secretion system
MPFFLLSPQAQQHPLDRLIYVGRDPLCAIRPPDSLVSRVHACLWLDRGVVRVRDERSSNGTFVNGVRLAAGEVRVLRAGDQVQVGETLYTLHGEARPSDINTVVEPPAPGVEPSVSYVPPAGGPRPDYVPPPTVRMAAPLAAAPAPAYAPPPAPAPARPARSGLSWPALLLGGCLGLLTLVLCGLAGFLLTPIGRSWLAGLFGGG